MGVKEGDRFGRLTVEKIGHSRDWRGGLLHLCRCDCGGTATTNTSNLKNGNTSSCGCLRRERIQAAKTTHGHNRGYRYSPTLSSWVKMRERCQNPKHNRYPIYGGRGIIICERWRHPNGGFENFLADMGERPEGHTLDRIDPDGNYEPDNCRWATKAEQAQNTRASKLKPEDVRAIRAAHGPWRAIRRNPPNGKLDYQPADLEERRLAS